MTPPGRVWHDDIECGKTHIAHITSNSLMAHRFPKEYKLFVTCNTISFLASLKVILILISNLPLKRRIFTRIAMLAMWIAIIFAAATYAIPTLIFTPDIKSNTTYERVGAVVLV
ncbi:hypothetical protein NL676_011481 [Syzygium grande]|nr:hypothetical protein NL676_011481 [Syzygium grande]